MLAPTSWPTRPATRPTCCAEALDGEARWPGAVPRDAALGVVPPPPRPHPAARARRVRDGDRWPAASAARRLAGADGRRCAACCSTIAAAIGDGSADGLPTLASRPPAATAAACWRRSATSTCCSSPGRARAGTLRAVEFMLYFLWDLGLKVGHATRSVAECLAEAERDPTVAPPCSTPGCWPATGAVRDVRGRFAARATSRRGAVHRRQAGRARLPATAASARARSWSSRTSRKAAAACATCRRCTGWRATCSAPTRWPSWSAPTARRQHR